MTNILYSTQWFLIPFSIFLFISIFISIDRILALRERVLGISDLKNFLLTGKFISKEYISSNTLFEKIILFFQNFHPEIEELQAYAELELNKLERGLFLLDIVISAAPLVGLLGTVAGLIQVFANFSNNEAAINNEIFANGVALALTTTALGLIIAIPAIIVSNTIVRKIDKIRVVINLLIERLINTNQDNACKKV